MLVRDARIVCRSSGKIAFVHLVMSISVSKEHAEGPLVTNGRNVIRETSDL